MRQRNISLPLEEIEAFCRRHPIRRLSLFGSVLREDFTEKSDVDFLVELDPAARIGLFEFMRMQFDLQHLVGRRVDLRTPEDLHERFRSKVVNDAEQLYEREN